ncbi:unnamed protein product [Paramecium octaurelia]|uniref:Uncharacterized protein n=1 Tax=Paramecium octaurelia TaxID=43137 RepID=A0A8S1WCA3_PAROT|nr:unnamed protein product [Paramecium octaurelia]
MFDLKKNSTLGDAEVFFMLKKQPKILLQQKKQYYIIKIGIINKRNFVHEQQKRVQEFLDQTLKKQIECLQIGMQRLNFRRPKHFLCKTCLKYNIVKEIKIRVIEYAQNNTRKTLEQTNEAFVNFIQTQVERLGI